MAKQAITIELTEEQYKTVNKTLRSQKTCRTIRTRCQILLDVDIKHGTEYSCAQAAHANNVTLKTVYKTLSTFRNDGLEAALTINRAEGSNTARTKVDGRAEAQLIKLATGPVPEGYDRWTLRLLEKEAKVVLDVPVTRSTIGKVLKKTNCVPTKPNTGVSRKKKTRRS